MPFVSFSSQTTLENTTSISNVFIEQYLPNCNGDCARVYLYGLYICGSASRYDNTLEHFSRNLGISAEDVESAFRYWETQGLVQVLSITPIEIKYLPVKTGGAKIKKYSETKYADFNAQIQSLIEGRMITPSEFAEYYSFLESFHVEPAALIMIAKYCTDIKGKNVGYPYILTVAKNWAYSGIKTVEAVKEKLETEAGDAETVGKLLKALGIKRMHEPTDFELYDKWTKKLGFSPETILHVAKKNKGGVQKLDNLLLNYFGLKLFEISEISDYENRKKELFGLAFAINKKIGVYYENVESIIETYISTWLLKGFDADTLLSIASFCFKSGIRTLEGMNKIVEKFFGQGIISTKALDDFIYERISVDKEIKEILKKLSLSREPNQLDRDFYNTWSEKWKTPADIIDYAATIATGKQSPMAYMNKILASFFEKNIRTLDEAKKAAKSCVLPAPEKQFIRHSYSDGELSRLFTNLDEVELK